MDCNASNIYLHFRIVTQSHPALYSVFSDTPTYTLYIQVFVILSTLGLRRLTIQCKRLINV